MVSEVTVLKFPACTGGRRGFGWCCGVIFVILLFIASCCLCGELNMPNPSEGESPNTARNLTGTRCDCACKYTSAGKARLEQWKSGGEVATLKPSVVELCSTQRPGK